jgi:hypothetical protein
MSRTVTEIYEEMITAKEAESGLTGLTSTSQTAIWRLIFYICAVSIKVMEDLYDVHEANVEARRLEIPVGVLKWYASESLVYQHGDTLIFADGRLDYATEDTDAQVIDLAAAVISNGILLIKAAKVTAGVAGPLNPSELSGFTAYWTEKRFAGTSITIISTLPDLLKAYYTIEYNPQLLATDGSLLSDPATFPVENAVDTFLQTFQSDNFNGDMRVMDLTDAIQAATGVVNVVATDVQGKPDGGAYIDILADATETYSSYAGYMKIDPAFPLSTTLTYTPST